MSLMRVTGVNPPIQMSACHPQRRAFQGNQCRACWSDVQFRQRVDGLPPSVYGVQQRTVQRVPEGCPHCGAPRNVLRLEGRLVECFLCGHTVHLTSDQVKVVTTKKETRPQYDAD